MLKRMKRWRVNTSTMTLVFVVALGSACTETVQTGPGSGGGTSAVDNTGHTSSELVSAGKRSTSPKYQMVFTLGQSSPHQGSSTSESYRLHSGIIGATGSEK